MSNGDGLLDPLAYTKGLPITVDVEVSNPNSYALEADKIQAELLVPDAQNMQIAVVKHPEKVRIPKYESGKWSLMICEKRQRKWIGNEVLWWR